MFKKIQKVFTVELETDKRVFGLDALRAFAIFLVIFAHGCLFILHEYFPGFPYFPYLDGVDLFFVLSGYLVGGIFIKDFYNKESYGFKDLLTFWKRRWIRTMPLYFLILALVLILAFLKHDFKLNKGIIPYFFFLQNFNWRMGWFFPESWSLSIEEWFYLIFPFIIYLFALSRIIIKYKKALTLFVVSGILLFSLLSKNYYFIYHPEYLQTDFFRKTVLLRLDSLMLGVLGAYMHKNFPSLWNKVAIPAFIVGITALILLPFLHGDGMFNYVYYSFTESIAVLLIFPFLTNIKTVKGRIADFVTRFSLVSYSMYMINWTLVINNLNFLFPVHSPFLAVIFFLIYFVLVYFISVLLFKYFEKPILALRDRKNLMFSFRFILKYGTLVRGAKKVKVS